jgi:NAD+-dependent secondary alcohol dehydrogenase Adh1
LDLVLREVSVVGNLVGTFNDLTELMALHSSGRVRVETRFLSLDDAPRAFEDLREGRVRGRTVLITES